MRIDGRRSDGVLLLNVGSGQFVLFDAGGRRHSVAFDAAAIETFGPWAAPPSADTLPATVRALDRAVLDHHRAAWHLDVGVGPFGKPGGTLSQKAHLHAAALHDRAAAAHDAAAVADGPGLAGPAVEASRLATSGSRAAGTPPLTAVRAASHTRQGNHAAAAAAHRSAAADHRESAAAPVELARSHTSLADESYDERRRQVEDQLREDLGLTVPLDAPPCGLYVKDLGDDWVVYCVGGKDFKRGYAISPDGTVVFDLPQQVQERRVYDPVSAEEAAETVADALATAVDDGTAEDGTAEDDASAAADAAAAQLQTAIAAAIEAAATLQATKAAVAIAAAS